MTSADPASTSILGIKELRADQMDSETIHVITISRIVSRTADLCTGSRQVLWAERRNSLPEGSKLGTASLFQDVCPILLARTCLRLISVSDGQNKHRSTSFVSGSKSQTIVAQAASSLPRGSYSGRPIGDTAPLFSERWVSPVDISCT